MSPKHSPIDVLIITALQDELKAVLEAETGWQVQRDSQGFTYHTRQDTCRDGRPIDMGRSFAATVATRLAQFLRPRCLAMCGICAGWRGKVELAERVDLSPADYIRRLGDARQRLKLTGVEPSLDVSCDLLSPDLQSRWRALGVFAGDLEPGAVAAVWGIEVDQAQDDLSELVRCSLVEWESVRQRYRLHELARLYTSERLEGEERVRASRRHAGYYAGVLREADALYIQGGEDMLRGLRLFDLEWANVQAGFAWADVARQAGEDEDEAAARLCSDYLDVGTHCLGLRQHPREQIAWLEAALAGARQVEDRAAQGRHLGRLGLAYARLGEMRPAIDLYEQHLAIAREIGDRRGEGADQGNLGLAYARLGKMRPAIEYYEQCLTIHREIGDQRGEGNALGNLGNAYADLGEMRPAIEYYEQCLTIHREIGDRRGEGADQGNLGLAYARLGKARRAIEHHEQALVILREIGDRRGEARASWNLGLALEEQGELARAAELMQVCVDYERQIGHPDADEDAAWLAALRARIKWTPS